MPLISIEVRKQYSQEQEIALMKAVCSALQKAFKISTEGAISVRLFVHEPHRFSIPLPKAHPELFTHISIDCFEGRSLEAKRSLYQQIVENLAALDIPKDHVKIVLRETPKENWGIVGGQAGCDVVDLGYSVEV